MGIFGSRGQSAGGRAAVVKGPRPPRALIRRASRHHSGCAWILGSRLRVREPTHLAAMMRDAANGCRGQAAP